MTFVAGFLTILTPSLSYLCFEFTYMHCDRGHSLVKVRVRSCLPIIFEAAQNTLTRLKFADFDIWLAH